MSVREVTPLLMSIPEAARALRIGRSSMYRLIERGEVEVVRIGERIVRVRPDALAAYIDRLRDSA